ncbi:PEGA domain-containing protein [Brevundimonas sp.]|uniref:PEGA domain-containing protein n=1 Tax=Brevundimonas sp. TaxID=1871086 RepID=UPI003BAA1CD8
MFSYVSTRTGVRLLALAGAALSLSACATVTRGSSQEFRVESTPVGARVETSNGFRCDATPCEFKISRKNPFSVSVSLDGYVTQEHEIETKVAGAGAAGMAGNLLVGGIIGGVVDASSGAMNDLTPNPLIVRLLTPAEQAAADTAARELAPATSGAAD